jgi:hypothetical protein
MRCHRSLCCRANERWLHLLPSIVVPSMRTHPPWVSTGLRFRHSASARSQRRGQAGAVVCERSSLEQRQDIRVACRAHLESEVRMWDGRKFHWTFTQVHVAFEVSLFEQPMRPTSGKRPTDSTDPNRRILIRAVSEFAELRQALVNPGHQLVDGAFVTLAFSHHADLPCNPLQR